MTIPLNVNGTIWNYPSTGDDNWGGSATGWANAMTAGTLQKVGGVFTLLADTNFGPTYGLISPYFKSNQTIIAQSGILRLADTDVIAWRNFANNADITLGVNAAGQIIFPAGLITNLTVGNSLTVNSMSTGIVHSNVSGLLSSSLIVNNDITNATITGAKLANNTITNSLIANATLTNSSLAVMANNTIKANNSGISASPSDLTASNVLDMVGGTQGDILYRDSTGWNVLAPGTSGYFLSSGGAAANPTWVPSTGTGTVTSVSFTGDGTLLSSTPTSAVTSSGTLTATLASGMQGSLLYQSGTGWASLAPSTSGYILATQGSGANPHWITAPVSLPSIANNDLLANTSGITAIPVATTLTTLIDSAIGSTQGDILYRGSSAWNVLAPGTSGQVLQTNGSAANPSWANVALAPAAQGSILYNNGTSWVGLGPTTSGYVLTTNGSSANPTWSIPGATYTAATVQDLTAGTDFTAGTSTTITLSAAPSNAAALSICFDGIEQFANTWTLAGTTVTFNAVIPVGVLNIEAKWFGVSTMPSVNGLITAGSNITITGAGTSVSPYNISGSASGVTSVSGTGTVSGLTLTGTVTSTGNLTLGGTLAVTPSNFASQTANTVLAAPNGSSGTPTFRALVAADVPTLNQNTTGNAATATNVAYSGLTGTVPTWNQNTTGSAATVGTISGLITAGSNITITGSGTAGSPYSIAGSAGGVSSWSGDGIIHSNSSSTGAVTETLISQTTNKVLASPNGSSGTPTFRALVAADIPTLNQNTTGSAATVGTISGLISAGTNVTITGSGTSGSPYSIAASGGGSGTVNSGTALQLAYYASNGTVIDGNNYASINGATVSLGTNGGSSGELILYGSTSGHVGIAVLATAGTYNFILPATAGSTGQVLTSAAGGQMTWTSAGTGTVTSVSGTGTVSGLTLSGTVTSSGNLTLGGTLAVTPSNFASQTANTFLAAPNGSAGTPTFRAMVAADVPTLNQNTTGNAATATNVAYSGLTGTVPTWNQNTTGNAATVTTNANLTGDVTSVGNATTLASIPAISGANLTSLTAANISAGTAGIDISGNAATVSTISGLVTAGSNITITGSGTSASPYSIAGTAGGVTSFTGDGVVLNNSASTGAVTGTLATVANNKFLAGPLTGGPLAPTYRSIDAADIPTLNQNTTGTAANITATSNSSLITLSSLSLPYSQLSGTVPTWNQNTTGNAATVTTNANLTGDVTSVGNATTLAATSNSTLTTLSSLSLPYSQLSGTVPTWNQSTTGNAATATLASTVTTNANLTGDVTSVGNATTLASIPAISGANLTSLTAANISAGTAGIDISGNAATATNVAYSGLTGTIPTWNQSTTGTAANITATSNSSLTTLSSLSLPETQVSGTSTQIAYADSTGFLGGDATFTFNDTTKTLSVTNISGALTGNVTGNVSGSAGTVTTISGQITAGTNVTITGSGTSGSPYNISASGGGGGGSINYGLLPAYSYAGGF